MQDEPTSEGEAQVAQMQMPQSVFNEDCKQTGSIKTTRTIVLILLTIDTVLKVSINTRNFQYHSSRF